MDSPPEHICISHRKEWWAIDEDTSEGSGLYPQYILLSEHKARIAELEAFAKKHATSHPQGCAVYEFVGPESDCTCGLDAERERLGLNE